MPKPSVDITKSLLSAARTLTRELKQIDFSSLTPWVYNPLEYAWAAHSQYIERYAKPTCQTLFLGMNPGPWGMAQTGVPFGEIQAVRGWLKIDAKIKKPENEHPKRPIEGMDCQRSEVSGLRLWGLFSDHFSAPDQFFKLNYVCNYCPLVFMEESARNITPDKLPVDLRKPLEAACDRHLARILQAFQPQHAIGVGAWAEGCLQRVIESEGLSDVRVGRILHPSPASPAANRDWAGTAKKQLETLGVW